MVTASSLYTILAYERIRRNLYFWIVGKTCISGTFNTQLRAKKTKKLIINH